MDEIFDKLVEFNSNYEQEIECRKMFQNLQIRNEILINNMIINDSESEICSQNSSKKSTQESTH
jgi:hypothetical protein